MTAEIDRVDADANKVLLTDGTELGYDYLIIASGTSPRPDQTPGMQEGEWRKSVHEFYTYEGATALAEKLEVVGRRPAGRAHHGDADQVPRRTAGVHVPRGRVLHRAGDA